MLADRGWTRLAPGVAKQGKEASVFDRNQREASRGLVWISEGKPHQGSRMQSRLPARPAVRWGTDMRLFPWGRGGRGCGNRGDGPQSRSRPQIRERFR